MNYYLVKVVVVGFEVSLIVYGDEDSMKSYIGKHFREFGYSLISDSTASTLSNDLGYKVYLCVSKPEVKENKDFVETYETTPLDHQ